MLAGMSILRGLRRWSQQLPNSALRHACGVPDLQVPRCAPSRAPRVSFGARVVCGGVLVTRAGANWAGGEMFRHVLAWDTGGTLDQCQSVRPYTQPHLTAQRTPYCVQQAPTSTMVCGGGGGAPAVAGKGVVKGLCARLQAHADVRQRAVLASRRGLTLLSHPPPPKPLACA